MPIAFPSRHTCEDLGDKQDDWARDVVKILMSCRRPAYLTCRQLTDGALPAIGDRWLSERGAPTSRGHPGALAKTDITEEPKTQIEMRVANYFR
jgi:hypothetical protein